MVAWPKILLDKTYEPASVGNFVTDLGQEPTVINVATAAVIDWNLQDIKTFDELKKTHGIKWQQK